MLRLLEIGRDQTRTPANSGILALKASCDGSVPTLASVVKICPAQSIIGDWKREDFGSF